MAFFGLTLLDGGVQNPFHDGSASTKHYPFHEIDDQVYDDAFREHVIGNVDIARQLQVDGESCILRSNLGNVLKKVLKKHPSKLELDTWFTCTMGFEEYLQAVSELKKFSKEPVCPAKYQSYDQMHLDWIKHKRVAYDPQKSLRAPVVSSQEIGWHTRKILGGSRQAHFPHHATDVTINEGRNLADYYGYITMM